MKSANLINQNIMQNITSTKIKKLKTQILKLKAELKESKYILSREQEIL